jgi:hypothetical protein
MAFCGQCGYQLRTGESACPRCGMVTQPMLTNDDSYITLDVETSNPDSPTAYLPKRSLDSDWQTDGTLNAPTYPNTFQQPQQPVVFRPVDNSPVTNPSSHPGANVSFPGHPPQSPQSESGYSPRTNPGSMPPGGYGFIIKPPPRRRWRGLMYLFVFALLFLLAVSGTLLWYMFYGRPSAIGGGQTPTPTVNSSPTTAPTLTPSQQAQAVIQQYYADINNHDYQDAYNLLGSAKQQQQSYNNFVTGYAHTHNDTITISNIAPQSDGTVIVTLTLKATEDASAGTGTQISTYQGTETVGQENGAWKILSGDLQHVSTVPG